MSKKIFLSVLVFLSVSTMLVLGFWQLDRHDQKKDINKKIDARISQTAVDILELDLDSGEGSILEDQEYRKEIGRAHV